MKKASLLLFCMAMAACSPKNQIVRDYIDLQGSWQFSTDSANIGIQQKWFQNNFTDSIHLPGTTDLGKKGILNKDTTTMHLCRVYRYEGAAWYRKKVVIPESFKDKHLTFFMERSKCSKVWIDNVLVDSSKILQSPQMFDVSKYLTPGEHFITIRVDNSLKITPYGNVHIYADDTQTNWNGIIGKLYVEASAKTYISNLQVYPDIDKKKISIKLNVDNQLNIQNADIKLIVSKTLGGKTKMLKPQTSTLAIQPVMKLEYNLGDDCSLWDEYQQPVYSLTVVLANGDVVDSKSVTFGMRKFSAKGTQFDINGKTTFLRGKHEAAVFPLTGCPPTNVEDWVRVYKIAKSYGINHYRFHSYCPPEAAFTAADQEGIYIQAELPFWGGLESDTIAEMLSNEGFAMLKAYANHPSFVLFSPGNEIWGGHDKIEKNMVALKQSDHRVLYCIGSNDNIGYESPRSYADFFVGARVPGAGDSTLAHTRLTHCFADANHGGILNTQTPSTNVEFNYAVKNMKIPVVSHEIGQYQIYPDYAEINKYTGVLRAWNMEVFRKRLEKAGMMDQNIDFQKASGAWAALCYKAEMEAAIRTKGLAGFQLLDLQDYPGQGTALVGILDAFMDSKNVVSKAEWLQSCNDVVLLLEFPKYCWTNKEKFQAKAIVANYSNVLLNKDLTWELKSLDGTVVQKGSFANLSMAQGKLTVVGEIGIDFSGIQNAGRFNLCIGLPGTSYANVYPIWIYPSSTEVSVSKDVIVTELFTADVYQKLQNGAKVLLFPQTAEVKDNSVPGLFPPEFWNYGMFKGISEWAKKPVSPGTLGILTNPKHPIFNAFATDFYTNWQWFSIVKASNAFVLDETEKSYRPIVQVIDNLERNHKMGLIFEFKVGKGKLLVCMSQLNQLKDKPEAAQLYRSMLNYMESNDFNPSYEITQEELIKYFSKK
jgi:hypothetical protein